MSQRVPNTHCASGGNWRRTILSLYSVPGAILKTWQYHLTTSFIRWVFSFSPFWRCRNILEVKITCPGGPQRARVEIPTQEGSTSTSQTSAVSSSLSIQVHHKHQVPLGLTGNGRSQEPLMWVGGLIIYNPTSQVGLLSCARSPHCHWQNL